MPNWTKIKREGGRGGRAARTTPCVSRARTGAKSARITLPAHMATGKAADFYTDGNGKLAIAFGDAGSYPVRPANKKGSMVAVGIPKKAAGRVPYGTTDVSLSTDGDMLVLDLNAIGGGA